MSMWMLSRLGLKDTFFFKYYEYFSSRSLKSIPETGSKRAVIQHNELHKEQ